MITRVKTKVLEVHENHVVCENKQGIWWLGNSTFKLPKDEALTYVKVGDTIEININPIDNNNNANVN